MKKRKEKGFTLIELLAVIVILAIIALIAVPIVMNLINKARKSAAEDSAYGVMKTAENYYAEMLLETSGKGIENDIIFTCSQDGCKTVDGKELTFKGTKPTGGIIKISTNGKVNILNSLKINGFKCEFKNATSMDIDCTNYDVNEATIDNVEVTNTLTGERNFTLTIGGKNKVVSYALVKDNEEIEFTDIENYEDNIITFSSAKSGRLSVYIKDEKGNVSKYYEQFYFEKMISPDSTTQISTLSDIGDLKFSADGNYTFLLENSESIVSEVYVINDDITYSENPILCDETNDEKMCIIVYEKNVTVNENVLITPQARKNGFLMYVKGTLINNGEISMTAKGSSAEGQDVLLYKTGDASYEYVPKVGGTGAASAVINKNSYAYADKWDKKQNGNTPVIASDALSRITGGGGSGSVNTAYPNSRNNATAAGGTGTSYAGGYGSGGMAAHKADLKLTLNEYAPNANLIDGANNDYNSCSGGGAGVIPGIGLKSKNAVSTSDGGLGAGGLLIIYANDIQLNAATMFTSIGSDGGGCTAKASDHRAAAGGGGSGGGSINIFAKRITNNSVTDITSLYNVSGGAGGVTVGSSNNSIGGAGGTGSFNIGTTSGTTYLEYSI